MTKGEEGDSYSKFVKGQLHLKSGAIGKKRKKAKKAQPDIQAEQQQEDSNVGYSSGAGIGGEPGSSLSKTYEELFPHERERMQDPKPRTAPYGNNYRAPPDVLHGRRESWRSKRELSAEERVELRSAMKKDKFC